MSMIVNDYVVIYVTGLNVSKNYLLIRVVLDSIGELLAKHDVSSHNTKHFFI